MHLARAGELTRSLPTLYTRVPPNGIAGRTQALPCSMRGVTAACLDEVRTTALAQARN